MKFPMLIVTTTVLTGIFAVPAMADAEPAAKAITPQYEHLSAREYDIQKAGRKHHISLPPMLIQKIDVVDDTKDMSSGEIAIPDVAHSNYQKYQFRK